MNLVVKAHQPWKSKFVWALITLVLVISGWTLFDYGRYLAGYNSKETATEIETLLDIQKHLENTIEGLREDKALLERAAQIERKAYNELDTTLKVLQSEILELKEELAFYRGIVSPKDSSSGLHLQNFTLQRSGKTQTYRYKVVLTQVLKNDRLASGKVRLKFEGLEKGEAKTLSLRQVTAKKRRELSYRFKYFQNVEGIVELPEDFAPTRITVQILPRGRERDMIEKTINWSFEEKDAHVGTEEEA